MDQLVPSTQNYRDSNRTLAFDRDSDVPLMLLDDLYIVELVVDEDAAGTSYDVFFLGSRKL